MEMELVPKEGYKIAAIKVGSLHRSIWPRDVLHNIKAAAWLLSSTAKAKES